MDIYCIFYWTFCNPENEIAVLYAEELIVVYFILIVVVLITCDTKPGECVVKIWVPCDMDMRSPLSGWSRASQLPSTFYTFAAEELVFSSETAIELK